MKIGYIFSMRKGMLGSTHREIKGLIESGIDIELYPIFMNFKYYGLRKEWNFNKFNVFLILLLQLFYFIRRPFNYLEILLESIDSKTLPQAIIAFDFAYKMKKRNIKLIHCHFGGPVFTIGYFCKRILGIPLTAAIHAGELYVNPNWRMFKKSLDFCDRIITISYYNKNLLVKKFGIDEGKIDVIRCFADLLAIKKKPINILIVGEFIEKKGHKNLFKAVKLLDRDDIYIWVVGEGKLPLEKLATELGIENRVIFWGVLPSKKLNAVYASCDIFCLPSVTGPDGNKEGIPAVLMEAMSFYKPVISTRYVGIPELVKEILVEENDIGELAKAISKLVDNPKLREQQGQENRNIIEKEYSAEKNVVKWRSFFSTTLSK